MGIFSEFIFKFYIGSTFGWLLELFFRRIAHGKWVNPGFLIGPYLPIYGFVLCGLIGIYLLFSFILGFFCGILIIDYFYSTKLLTKIRNYAKENNIEVKYEKLKCQIRDIQEKEKYSFLFALKPSKNTKSLPSTSINWYKPTYGKLPMKAYK